MAADLLDPGGIFYLLDAHPLAMKLDEHEFGGWQIAKVMVRRDDGWWVMPEGQPQMPLSFSIKATKR